MDNPNYAKSWQEIDDTLSDELLKQRADIHELIAKAVPMEAIYKNPKHSEYLCPICHCHIVAETHYCHNCGQRLEWRRPQ